MPLHLPQLYLLDGFLFPLLPPGRPGLLVRVRAPVPALDALDRLLYLVLFLLLPVGLERVLPRCPQPELVAEP